MAEHFRAASRALRAPTLVVGLVIIFVAMQVNAQGRRDRPQSQHLNGTVHLVSGGGGANVSFSAGRDGVLVVDSKNMRVADDILEFAAAVTSAPVHYLVNTHEHPDHTDGNARFTRAGALIVAHEDVREVLEAGQRGGPPADNEAWPVLTYSDFGSINFDFNGEIIEVVHVAPAHSTSNSIVYFNGSNVFHMGDLFSPNRYPVIAGGTYAGFISVLNTAIQKSNVETIVVPGSGPVSDREGMIAYREMLITVRDRVIEALDQGQELEQFIATRPTREFDGVYGDPGHALFLPVLYQEMRARRP